MKTQWPQGRFCWLELASADLEASKGFYGEVLGWKTKELPMPGDAAGNYTMWFFGDDRNVGGAHVLSAEEKANNVPPHWMAYIAVDDIDAVAAKGKTLGGKVMVEPFDIPNTGRMAVLADPTGANVALWSTKSEHGGAYRVADGEMPEMSMLCWTELLSSDPAASEAFYAGLVGWTVETNEMMGMPYTIFRAEGQMAAGMMTIAEDWGPIPPHWTNYFQVPDCDATCEKVQRLGGRQLMPAMDLPEIGRVAMLMDPQGAGFSIISPPK